MNLGSVGIERLERNVYIYIYIYTHTNVYICVYIYTHTYIHMCIFTDTLICGFPCGSVGKESACRAGEAGDVGSISGLGKSPEGRHGNPFQYSCLENPIYRGAWWATVHRVTKSQA